MNYWLQRLGTAILLLLAVSMLRSERSLAYLLEMLACSPRRRGENVLRALAIHRHDRSICERVRSLVPKVLRDVYESEFETLDD